MKKVAILLSLIVFCFAQNNTSTKTDIAGKWNLSALTSTYERKVVTGSGIKHSADKYDLVASWNDAAGFAAAWLTTRQRKGHMEGSKLEGSPPIPPYPSPYKA